LRNPYEHLTTTQTYQLSGLYQLREWIKVNQPAPESFERKELQRLEDLFEAVGIDAEELLHDADEARAYWSAQSRGTNADITESPILIDGYVLPLGTEASQGRAQKKLINEFLLVP
ncbi:MAG: transporter, partial [Cyanobacteria bacterium J06649_12]